MIRNMYIYICIDKQSSIKWSDEKKNIVIPQINCPVAQTAPVTLINKPQCKWQ